MTKIELFEILKILCKEKNLLTGFNENNLPSVEFLLRSIFELNPNNEIFKSISDKILIDVPKGNIIILLLFF